jgi:hypothetical protein
MQVEAAANEQAAGAVRDREIAVWHLHWMRLAAQLPDTSRILSCRRG